MNKVNILGVHVNKVTIPEAADAIFKMLDENRPHHIFTPNSEIIMQAYKDEDFCKILNDADLLTADGIGVVTEVIPLAGNIKVRLNDQPDVAPKLYNRNDVKVLSRPEKKEEK